MSNPESKTVRHIARGGALNLVGAVVYGASNFLLVVVITSLMGAQGTGEFMLAIAVFNIIARASELGATTGCVRFISRNRATGRHDEIPRLVQVALIPVFVTGLIMAPIIWLAAPWIGSLVADPSGEAAVSTYLRYMAPFIPVASTYAVAVQGSRGFASMRIPVLVDKIARPALQLCAIAVILIVGGPHSRVDIAWAAPFFIASIPTMVWIRSQLAQAAKAFQRSELFGRTTPSYKEIGTEFWKFSFPRAFGRLFQIAVLWFDTLFIGALRSAEEAGIYAASTRYLMIGMFAGEALMQVLAPHVSQFIAQRDLKGAQRIVETATVWQVSIIWPTYVTAIFFAPTLLRIFGEEFVVATNALIVLAIGMLINSVIGQADIVVLMAGRSRLSMINAAATLIVNVVGNLTLTPRIGIMGAAISWAASLVVTAALPAFQMKKATGISAFRQLPVEAAAIITLVVGVPATLVVLIAGQGVLQLIVSIVLGGIGCILVGRKLAGRFRYDELVAAFKRN